MPKELDIYDLEQSFVPERWLDPATTPTVFCTLQLQNAGHANHSRRVLDVSYFHKIHPLSADACRVSASMLALLKFMHDIAGMAAGQRASID